MADKVVRLSSCDSLAARNSGDDVVLTVTGRSGGKEVRVEIPLHSYAIIDLAGNLRGRVKEQRDKWQRVVEDLK